MNDKQNILSFITKNEVGIKLLYFSLALLLVPYLAGVDLGKVAGVEVKVPPLPPRIRKHLQIIGPLFLLLVIVLQLPIISIAKSGSFQNFEPNNGTPGRDALEQYCRNIWFAPCVFEPAKIHTGTRSIRVEAQRHPEPNQTGGTVRIFPSSIRPLDLSTAKSISVWVYDSQGSNTVELKLCNGDNCPDKVWSAMKSTKDKWVEITWPISSCINVDKHNITGMELYEWNDGVYYFDDINWQ